jgi:hypothetical protein
VITGEVSLNINILNTTDIINKYSISSLTEEEYITDCFFHVPIILDPEDIPCEQANSFILSKLTSNKDRTTIEGYAKVLVLFLNFCEYEEIDYLQSTSKFRSPLARFKRDQLDKIEAGKLSPSTVKERLSKLVQFYRYLVDEFKIKFKVTPWIFDKEGLKLIQLQDRVLLKKYKTSDIQQVKGASRETSEQASFAGEIFDSGERLRPLPESELKILFKALSEIGNTEMTLAHKIIAGTGARTQTIFTLRQCHFEYEPNVGEEQVYIKAGRWQKEGQSLADSKLNNPFLINMPIEIYRAVKVYIRSQRAKNRYEKAKYRFDEPRIQYVFMTQQGSPFYVSKSDPYRMKYKNIPSGQALTTFVNSILKPKLTEMKFENPQKRFKFHNLRASYGLMRLNFYLEHISKGQNVGKAYDKALQLTQKDMNHKSLKTTLNYVQLQENSELIAQANSGWSHYLKEMAGV